MSQLKTILELAKRGFHVFPLQPNNKKPVIADFVNRATRDPRQIREWWLDPVLGTLQPYNVGISTTKYNGNEALVVVDVDNKGTKNGSNQLLRLERDGYEFDETLTQETPTGGLHLIYRANHPVKQGVDVLANGIDIRSKGGYIVGPGSTIDGKSYRWREGYSEIQSCPKWIVERCGKPTEKQNQETRDTKIDREYANARAEKYLLSEAPVAISGQGGDLATSKVAAKMKDFGVAKDEAFFLLAEFWNPKCEPPWDEDDLRKKVENAFRYGSKAPGSDAPENDFSQVEDDSRKRKLRYELFCNIRPRLKSNYLVKGLLDKEAMSVVFGDSNSGKTFFALDLCFQVALGQEWQNMKVRQGGVVYIAAEGGMSFSRRIEAIRISRQLDPNEKLPFALVPCPIDLASEMSDVQELVDLISKVTVDIGISVDLLVVDTLSRAMAGGNENASEDMGAFIRNVDAIRERTKSHVMIIHHTGKDQSRGARGHSSLRAAADTEILIKESRATIQKQRDMDIRDPIGFHLRPISVGADEDGHAVTSCVVEFVEVKKQNSIPKEGTNAAVALGILRAMFAAHTTLQKIETSRWREKFLDQEYKGAIKQTRFTAFVRVKTDLIARGLVAEEGKHVYFA